MDEIVKLLRRLPPGRVDSWDGATDEAIKEIESIHNVRLPEDLRAALHFSNGFSVTSPRTSMEIFRADQIARRSTQAQFKDDLPGMLILGTDGEGSVYYADANNRIGRGAFAVYLVRMSDMDIPSSMPVGSSFTDAVRTIANETDIYARPQLREPGA